MTSQGWPVPIQAPAARRATARPVRALRTLVARYPLLLVGAVLVGVLVVLAVAAPLLVRNSPYQIGLGPSMSPPSANLWFGTDKLGRDLFSRIVYGSRTTLLVSIPSVLLAMVFGLGLGLSAGYFGGRTDQVIMRLMDILLAFPSLLLALAIVAVLGPSIRNLLLTIGILYIPSMARVVRGPVLAAKEREYITAARTIGAGTWRILLRHVLPNILSPIIVDATLATSRAILVESALSYLGLGAPPPNPSWGEMLSSSRQFMTLAPWSALFPGLAIVYAATAFILLGNGLRDWLDPRRR
ncbi:MAG: ABC transporter permease [Anaerolineae bacterium]|nr:ABC transporter permease [Anaerolineae bacterium]